jgi:hypothetical protein
VIRTEIRDGRRLLQGQVRQGLSCLANHRRERMFCYKLTTSANSTPYIQLTLTRLFIARSLDFLEVRQHIEQVFGQDHGRVFLHVIRAEPRFVTAQAMVFGSGQVSVTAISQADDH